ARVLARTHLCQHPGELAMRQEIARDEAYGTAQIVETLALRFTFAGGQAHTEMETGGRVVRIERERGAQAHDRFGAAAGAAQHAAEGAMGSAELRVETRRALGKRDRRGRVAVPPEGEAQLKVRDGVVG